MPIPQVILIGHPNVGKSQLFNLLTGSYVAVSNYPGTTVELSSGKGVIAGRPVTIVDSPGLYSLHALSEEEQVTRLLLFTERPALVIQVVDARNLLRMLSLTLELAEAQLPLILVANLMDEALSSGLLVNCRLLSRRLGIPVIPTVLVDSSGLQSIKQAIATCLWGDSRPFPACGRPSYDPVLEAEIQRVSTQLQGRYGVSRRAVAMALLNPDPGLEKLVALREGKLPAPVISSRRFGGDPLLHLAGARRALASCLLKGVEQPAPPDRKQRLAENLNRLLVSPAGGGIILGLVLYFGFYRFVGVLGAQVLVNLLEERLFLGMISPWLNSWGERLLPWAWLQDLLLADYGIISLGLRYTFTVIFPIMATFFLFFSVIEDSGYLPRAAYLINLLMEKIGLNGKSVIPLSLGLGCGTLAILATRTLESRQERLRACLMLSLAVPCSAQLGLILALLASGAELVIWLAAILTSFLAAAYTGRLLFQGESPPFCLEIPPVRIPRPGAILKKTGARLRWYLREIWGLFIGLSVAMWALNQTGLLARLIEGMRPALSWLGLPEQVAVVFIYGFLRRDYGAAGLFDLARSGALNRAQVLVAAVVLTLFLPCAAQLAMIIREHGWRPAWLVVSITTLICWLWGALVNQLIRLPFIWPLICR